MPFGDGTGPNGMGPRTGRGLGYCGGYNSPGFTKGAPRGYGRGYGRGFGFGRGFGRGFGMFAWNPYANAEAPSLSKKDEQKYLQQELELLEGEMKEIKDRLKELKK